MSVSKSRILVICTERPTTKINISSFLCQSLQYDMVKPSILIFNARLQCINWNGENLDVLINWSWKFPLFDPLSKKCNKINHNRSNWYNVAWKTNHKFFRHKRSIHYTTCISRYQNKSFDDLKNWIHPKPVLIQKYIWFL